MPIFEYVCDQCQERVEKLVRTPEEPAACPQCGSPKMALQFSVFGFSAGQENRRSFVGSRGGGCGCTPGGCGCRT